MFTTANRILAGESEETEPLGRPSSIDEKYIKHNVEKKVHEHVDGLRWFTIGPSATK
jgi:hypothetical protein